MFANIPCTKERQPNNDLTGSRQPDIYNEVSYMQIRVYTANHISGNAFTLFAYYGYVYNQAYAQGKKYLGMSVRSHSKCISSCI